MKLKAIGTDFEFLVSGPDGITSAIGQIGGTKDEPLWVDGGNLQEDNVLAEAATHPIKDRTKWMSSITALREKLEDRLLVKGLYIEKTSSHHFTTKQLQSYGKEALVFGCDPDTDAWTDTKNIRPDATSRLRTAAAHVHFSYTHVNHMTTRAIILTMDYLLGLWSVTVDDDTVRRQLYGKAGSCRYKRYGGEYRALSNFWIFSEEYANYVWDMTHMAVKHGPQCIDTLTDICEPEVVQQIINGYYRDEAITHHREVQAFYNDMGYANELSG